MMFYRLSNVCKLFITLTLSFAAPVSVQAAEQNLANGALVTADSTYKPAHFPASSVVDEHVGQYCQWSSGTGKGPHWLILKLRKQSMVASANLYFGHLGHAKSNKSWIPRNFRLQVWDHSANKWSTVDGGRFHDNKKSRLHVVFKEPVKASKFRLFIDQSGRVQVAEITLFGLDASGASRFGTAVKDIILPPEPNHLYVMVNQIGYNSHGPKRFTAPNAPDGASFSITKVSEQKVLYQGNIEAHVGDFTDFQPREPRGEYVIHVRSDDKKPASSYPFRIAPLILQRSTLATALHFMIDDRSLVGTHPSAYGGAPWRDGTYYSYEVPSLVLMYLAAPEFFNHLTPEIHYEVDKQRVLNPDFEQIRARGDKGALKAVRDYYKKLSPPRGARVPDLIQLLHWGIGYYLMQPATKDPSGDPIGRIIHPQTVEQFAYFLYGYPYYRQYFSNEFYQRALHFALSHWGPVGLFDVIKKVGSPKGRHCPGHSIAPNLMMYKVARREGQAKPERFLNAAVNQAAWVIGKFKPGDPRVTKGQRMSEHMLMTGLFLLEHEYPKRAPNGLKKWLKKWISVAVQRSDNMWDFRKYDATHWTLPKKWNEPGNIAGLPAIVTAVAAAVPADASIQRLWQIKTAAFDDLFGRNPLGAASPAAGSRDYRGIDHGWPKAYFGRDQCARLWDVRGTLNSTAGSEDYPFRPQGGLRHPEGWTAFNAAFNVSLAFTSWQNTDLELSNANGKPSEGVAADRHLLVTLRAPMPLQPPRNRTVVIQIRVGNKQPRTLSLNRIEPEAMRYVDSISLAALNVKPGHNVTFSYGYGFLRHTLMLRYNPKADRWQRGSPL